MRPTSLSLKRSISTVRRVAGQNVTTHKLFSALFDEVNVNYLAIVALTKFFLPHFLKLSVSYLVFDLYFSSVPTNYLRIHTNPVRGASDLHHSHQLGARYGTGHLGHQLLCNQGGSAQFEHVVEILARRHECPHYGDTASVSITIILDFSSY